MLGLICYTLKLLDNNMDELFFFFFFHQYKDFFSFVKFKLRLFAIKTYK